MNSGNKYTKERSKSLVEKAYEYILEYTKESVSYSVMQKIVKDIVGDFKKRSCAGFRIEAMKLSIILWLISQIELVKNRRY